jgi:hypothetical protein
LTAGTARNKRKPAKRSRLNKPDGMSLEDWRVVNFVAQGTIEEGMLSVLRFKKSLFAGMLDGGETEVFLGGSRLNKFMETVESTTKAIPEAMAEDAVEAPEPASRAASAPRDEANGEAPTVTLAAADPWAGRSSGTSMWRRHGPICRTTCPRLRKKCCGLWEWAAECFMGRFIAGSLKPNQKFSCEYRNFCSFS